MRKKKGRNRGDSPVPWILRLILSMLEFEWDPEKEAENFRIHGVHFETAAQIFGDWFRKERWDDDSSEDEDRWQSLGAFDEVLFVVHTERENRIRIISARIAAPSERRIYHGDGEIYGWRRVNP
jgi:uncharacterized DUF497 family protein